MAAEGAASGPAGALAEGSVLLVAATDAFFDQSAGTAELRALLERGRRAFSRVEDDSLRFYWLAEVAYLQGFLEQADERPKAAQERFEEGRDLVLASLDIRETSEGYRLLADTYAQLLILNGLLYKMSYGPKVREMAEEALRLEPGNLKAQLTLALFYKNAPAIAGGSRTRSLELLHAVEGGANLQRVDRFSVNAWLGIAYTEDRRPVEARRYLQRAQSVYPGNTWLKGMLAEMPS